jgi:hypothetical protein
MLVVKQNNRCFSVEATGSRVPQMKSSAGAGNRFSSIREIFAIYMPGIPSFIRAAPGWPGLPEKGQSRNA